MRSGVVLAAKITTSATIATRPKAVRDARVEAVEKVI
jgi:hypothetical protein